MNAMPDREHTPPDSPAVPDDAALPFDVHETIQQQIAEVLASAGLSEEEKQQILVAMQCPCCGAGGLSLSIKLGPPRNTPKF